MTIATRKDGGRDFKQASYLDHFLATDVRYELVAPIRMEFRA